MTKEGLHEIIMKWTIKKGSVIQVNESNQKWFGCLMIVDKFKEWGVSAYMTVPGKGTTYARLKHGEYEFIGPAVYAEGEEDD